MRCSSAPASSRSRGVATPTAVAAVGVPLVLALLGPLWLLGRARLRRVDRIRRGRHASTRRSCGVGSGRATVDDEVGRLATTMNRMLARLEQARERQRAFVADASHDLQQPARPRAHPSRGRDRSPRVGRRRRAPLRPAGPVDEMDSWSATCCCGHRRRAAADPPAPGPRGRGPGGGREGTPLGGPTVDTLGGVSRTGRRRPRRAAAAGPQHGRERDGPRNQPDRAAGIERCGPRPGRRDRRRRRSACRAGGSGLRAFPPR